MKDAIYGVYLELEEWAYWSEVTVTKRRENFSRSWQGTDAGEAHMSNSQIGKTVHVYTGW